MRKEHMLAVAQNLIVDANPTYAIEIKSHVWDYLGDDVTLEKGIYCIHCRAKLDGGQMRFRTCPNKT